MAHSVSGATVDGVYASDKNQEYDYVLRYIAEAVDNRSRVIEHTARAIAAYQGEPSSDGYIGAVSRYAEMFKSSDNERYQELKRRCESIRPRKSMIVSKSIDSMVAQAMGGVGQYECAPYDPHLKKSDDLVDMLSEAAMNFYNDNHVDAILPQAIEFAGLGGSVYAYLGYKLDNRADNGKIDIQLVPSTEMLLDPMRSKRNRDRYIGFQQPDSWKKFKDKLHKGEHTDQWVLESINNVDTWIGNVEAYVNKYGGRLEGAMNNGAENLPPWLDKFYKPSALTWSKRESKFSSGVGTNTNSEDGRYEVDEIEVSYVYDIDNRIQFTVINRTFIVEAREDYLEGSVDYNVPLIDPVSGNSIDQPSKKKVTLDHPFVALEYKRSLWQTYAYSPIIEVLDTFDDICALESLIFHTIGIMTPITFTGNPKDIEKLGQIAGVSGETIKGFIANSVTVLNKAVDLTPALTEVSRLESIIADKLNGLDVREQSRMVGDRATAAEAMGVASLVSQGLNPLIANIERFAEELMMKVFKLTIIYSDSDFEYNFSKDGKMQSITRQDLAGDFRITAKLRSKIKAEQHAQSASTMQWFVPLMGSDAIKNKEAFAQSVIPTLAQGFTRKTVSGWFVETPEEKQLREAQISAMQEQQAAAEATKKAAQGVDTRFVDPTNGGEFGAAQVAATLGGNAPAPDMSAEPSPVGGPVKPGPSSRKLGYGIGNGAPEPLGFPLSEVVTPTPQNENPPEEVDAEAQATSLALAPFQTPTSGGTMANDPFTGANSPLSQQEV